MTYPESFFALKFGIQTRDLEGYLSEALSQGGDYADLYFEYLATSSISIDESIVKSATQGVSLGVGVRVISGERTGYAYSDDLDPIRFARPPASPPASRPDPRRPNPSGCMRVCGAIYIPCSPHPPRRDCTSAWNWSSAPTARPGLTIRACFK